MDGFRRGVNIFLLFSIYRKTEDFDGSASVAEGGLPEGKKRVIRPILFKRGRSGCRIISPGSKKCGFLKDDHLITDGQ